MTNHPNNDAELISRLLRTQPTPAECLVAAARIEQLRDRLARMEGALQIAGPIALRDFERHPFILNNEEKQKVAVIRAALTETTADGGKHDPL